MKTNFETWYRRYAPVLFVYYQRFSAMFDPSEKPTFHQFMVHCFRNTKQTYISSKREWRAPVF